MTLDRYIPEIVTAASSCKSARRIWCNDLQCVRNDGEGRCTDPLIRIHGEQQACSSTRIVRIDK